MNTFSLFDDDIDVIKARWKAIGNGQTVDVIARIFSFIKKGEETCQQCSII